MTYLPYTLIIMHVVKIFAFQPRGAWLLCNCYEGVLTGINYLSVDF